jgi:7-cyano-7-deazaguanine reductase
MSSVIESIASKHLGKAGDGSVVKPYVTPDAIDASLLVGIPRELNRTQYDIDSTGPATIGFDVWNAYEVSTLMQNGFPVNFYVRIGYSSQSPRIVESKSLKLYFNSFNMHRFLTLDAGVVAGVVEAQIKKDLTPILGVEPEVGVHEAHGTVSGVTIPSFPWLENSFNPSHYDFDVTYESANLLLVDENATKLAVRTATLRSNCRVTNQPDWGDVYIAMEGGNVPTLVSLTQYIVSMRKENHFHEEICECIYKRLHDKFKPEQLMVACLYTRRGGIDINPVRYSSKPYFEKYFPDFLSTQVLYKTIRQ